MFGRLVSTIFNNITPLNINPARYFRAKYIQSKGKPSEYMQIPIKRQVRNYFPRPRETKKIASYGWERRMSTLHGRKVIMNRILRGHYNLSL